jgi:hypothetical protein
MSDNTLEALPIGLGAVNERSLKRLLLIFDKVCLPDPSEQEYLLPPYSISHDGTKLQYPNASDPLYNGERFKRIESDILNKYDYARKRNSITCLNLRHSGFYGKYALPLKLTRLADVTNPVILELLSPLCEKTQTQNIVGAPRADFIGVPQKNRQIQFINLSFNIPDTDCNLEEYVSMIGRINRLLIVSEYFNLVPVFTEDAAFEFFRRKIDLARNLNCQPFNIYYLEPLSVYCPMLY